MPDEFHIRVHGDASLPTLIYLPGLHGDWTLVSSFRAAVAGRARFVEFAYARRPAATLQDYAGEVLAALGSQGIHSGWLLGESFGSQVAWALLERTGVAGQKADVNSAVGFRASGLILAGGFVRHPWPYGARLLRWQAMVAPVWAVRGLLRTYQAYAGFRHRAAPETRASVQEFVARRMAAMDRETITARLALIAANDPRRVAQSVELPVHYLAGSVDPLVPWPWVRWWLRRRCPTYQGGRTLWLADHNVLATQPQQAAQVVLGWMRGAPGTTAP